AEMLVAQNSEHYYEAELYRVRGELRFAISPQEIARAEADIERAIDIAHKQRAMSLQLRATMSLWRLHQGERQSRRTLQRLHDIYQSFSEGFDTMDLQMAQSALRKLSHARSSSSSN